MSPRSPLEQLRRRLLATGPGPRLLGPRAALAHQLTLSACLLVGVLLVSDRTLGNPALYWGGQVAVHLFTLVLLVTVVVGRAGRVARPRSADLLILLPVADLLVLAVSRWSLANVMGFQGFLMAVPCVWLAAQLRYRGAMLGIGISLLSVPLGLVITPELDPVAVLSRGLASSLLVAAMGLVVASAMVRLDEHTRRLEAVSASLGVVSLVLDEDGRVLESSGRLRGASRGLDVHDLLADPVFGESGRSPLPPERNPLARAARGSELDGEAVWSSGATGRRVALSVSSTRLDPDRMLVVVHDVTASLGAVLQEEQFLANISHELKTPLTSITGYVELIEDEVAEGAGGDPETIRRHLAVVSRNVERLQRLILGLLETARTVSGDRIGSGGGPRRVIALDELLRRQVEALEPRLRARRLRVDLAGVAASVELVNADPERLGQAVDNVLTNAVKYAHEGGTVTVSLGTEGPDAVLGVADEGIGIGAEDLERLFTPYFRARTATGAGVAGYGLGLMITRRIVRAHGGEMAISSEVGVGTRVEMRIPLVRT